MGAGNPCWSWSWSLRSSFAPSRLMGARNPCGPWSWSLCSSFLSLRDLWAPGTRAGLGGTRAGLGVGHCAQAFPLETGGRREPVPVLELVTVLKVIADLYPLETYGRREPVLVLEMVTALKLFPSRLMGARNPCGPWSWSQCSSFAPSRLMGTRNPCRA